MEKGYVKMVLRVTMRSREKQERYGGKNGEAGETAIITASLPYEELMRSTY